MKENIGKILFAIVSLAVIVCIGTVFYTIFSHDTNIDMLIVWMIFVAEGIKNVLKSGWNSSFCFVGSVSLIIWAVYFIFRIATSKGEIDIGDGDTIDSWDQKKEAIFQRYGHVFWKVGLTFWAISLSMDFIAAGIPTAKQSAVIYIVPKMVNNVDMQEIPPNLAKLVNEGLKEMILSVKGDVGEAAKEAVKDAANATKEVAKDAVGAVAEKAKQKIEEKADKGK